MSQRTSAEDANPSEVPLPTEAVPTEHFGLVLDSDDPTGIDACARSADGPPHPGAAIDQVQEPTAGISQKYIVIDTEDTEPITPTIETTAERAKTTAGPVGHSRIGMYALSSVAAFIVIFLIISIAEWVSGQFDRSSSLGCLALLALGAAIGLSLWWLATELKAWLRLAAVDGIRADLSDTGPSEGQMERFLSAVGRLERSMQRTHRQPITRFLIAQAGSRQDAEELRASFERKVLVNMDVEAITAVHRAVNDVFLICLISPSALTDTLAFIARAFAMIRQVASAYGHRPGKLGTYRLMRRILGDLTVLFSVAIIMSHASDIVGRTIRGVAQAGATALAATGVPVAPTLVRDAGEALGTVADVAAKEISEALAAAGRMAKLGLVAIDISRPMKLGPDQSSEMAHKLRKMVLTLRRPGGNGSIEPGRPHTTRECS